VRPTTDFLVVGGGIVGLTTALELRRRGLGSVALLEKESELGRHASGRNSGVVHAGIYYAADSLKARLCTEGARRLRDYAGERGLPLRRCGKVIVATSAATAPQIAVLHARGVANGVRVELIGPDDLRRLEPEAVSHGPALHSPDTAITDPGAVMTSLTGDAVAAGVRIERDVTVTALQDDHGLARTTRGEWRYGTLVNCAGLQADRLAHAAGVALDYAILPFRGMYRKLDPNAAARFRGCVYPAPDLRVPFLGVHVTPTVAGGVTLGPTAMPALGRENYRGFAAIEPREALRMAWDLGRMLLLDRHGFRRMAAEESARYLKRGFLRDAQTLAPRLRSRDIGGWVKVGIRAQLIHRQRLELMMDFLVEAGRHSVHVMNAVSPAFTSSLAFAELVVDRAQALG
jgi:(S)-2-hydroxyglutarate dehydrogenase